MPDLLHEERFIERGYECSIKKTGFKPSPAYDAYPFLTRPWYCGYVRIPENHPFYKIPYDESPVWNIDCHGGLTFSAMLKDGWWIGFDCNHCDDDIRVQDFDYTKNEIIGIVDQLIKAEKDFLEKLEESESNEN